VSGPTGVAPGNRSDRFAVLRYIKLASGRDDGARPGWNDSEQVRQASAAIIVCSRAASAFHAMRVPVSRYFSPVIVARAAEQHQFGTIVTVDPISPTVSAVRIHLEGWSRSALHPSAPALGRHR
jgi:hypothetical protein